MRRLLPFVILILLILGAIVAVPLLLQPDRHRAEVAAYLSKRLHHEVTLGKLEAGLLPPTLKMNAVAVLRADKTPAMQSDHVDVGLDLASLLRFKIQPASVRLSRWNLTIQRRLDGSWDLDEWTPVGSGGSASEALPIRSASFKDGEVRWVDLASGRQLAVQSIEGELDAAESAKITGTLATQPPASLTYEGKGIVGGPSWSGDLRLGDEGRQWILQLQGQKEGLEAKGQAKQWRLAQAVDLGRFLARLPADVAPVGKADVMLQDWRTQFTCSGSTTSVYHAATIEGGLTEVNAQLLGQADGIHLRLKGTVQELPVVLLERQDAPLLTDAKLNAIVTDFDMALSTRALSTLSAKGNFDLHRGRYRMPAASVKVLAKAKTMGYLKTKFPGFPDEGLPFDKVTATVDVTRGMAQLSEGRFRAQGLEAAMAGRVDLASRGSDAYVRLQIHETDPSKIRLIPNHYVYAAGGAEQIQPMYGHLQGTWRDWILRAVPASKIPSAIQARLRAIIKNP